jgi:DNA polymerase III epsilon subunit-like protein
MRVIAVDLEMNQPSGKIIQIGAVCFQPDKGSLIETFNQLINPGETITQEIEALTGIKNEDVRLMPSIGEGAQTFSDFKQRLQINPIGVVWGAGKSNDVRRIFDEAGTESPFKPRIIDVKGVFQMLANASGAKMRQKVGLNKACELLALGWDSKFGEQHNALADAFNTMRVYMFLSKCLKGGVEIKMG